jgi:LysM repeat protein
LATVWFGVGNWTHQGVPKDLPTVRVTVQPGDTLWGLATHYDTRDSAWSVETWVERKNHLHSALIYPGEQLLLPVDD